MDGLTAIGGFLMTVYTFIVGDHLDSYLLKKIFKRERDEESESNNQSTKQQFDTISRRRPFIMNLCPLCTTTT